MRSAATLDNLSAAHCKPPPAHTPQAPSATLFQSLISFVAFPLTYDKAVYSFDGTFGLYHIGSCFRTFVCWFGSSI